MRSLRALAVSASMVLTLASLPSSVQTQAVSGSIEGRITDNSGAVLPGVTVIASGIFVGGEHRAVTDASGTFRLSGLTPGRYRLRMELAGFKSVEAQVTVSAGQVLKQNAVLNVAGVAETVEVTAGTPMIDTRSSAAGATIVMGGGGGAGGTGGATFRAGVAATTPAPSSYRPYPPWRYSGAPYNTTSFDTIDENPFVKATDTPLSTFSIDVDTASYAFVRRMLSTGVLPQKDAVRIEELLNYFHYDYPNPTGNAPFSVTTDVARCPWNPTHLLAHIGLQARRLDRRETPPRNLVFLLDVSGSMEPADKLPLVKAAMQMLTTRLTARDTVGIVVYASSSGVVLPPTRGDQQDRILDAIDHLHAGGSTNGAEGLETAYHMAREHFDREGINRVILASDGDFNTGMSSRGDLMRLIEEERKSGVALSVLGVGTDNLKDGMLEQLADRGNGNYAYLDSLEEAHKVLLREASATLVTVAKDVKIQVEFNPAQVAAYRLIGYENRALKAEDFKDDRKDAGEIGAGHSVTALYEILPAGVTPDVALTDDLRYQQPRSPAPVAARTGELMWVKLRYKHPNADTSTPLDVVVKAPGREDLRVTPNMGFSAAVAAFGLLLRDSAHKGGATWQMAADLAERYRGDDPDGSRAQFAHLVEMAEGLARTRPHTHER
jgi:Ca-activated chloride channel family protein